jgi:hypothetical protein
MGEFALSETLRAIIVQEQEHEIDLSTALGIDVPAPEAAAKNISRTSSRINRPEPAAAV